MKAPRTERYLYWAILLLFAVLPLDSFGFKIGYFRVGIPMLVLYGMSLFVLPYIVRDKATAFWYVLLVVWAGFVTFTRWPAGYVVKPIGALVLISLPIFIRPNCVTRDALFKALTVGVVINLVINVLNVAIYYSGVGLSMAAIVGDFYIGNSFILKKSLLRLQGGFSEPAHHSIYCLAVTLAMAKFGYLNTGRRWWRWCVFGALIGMFVGSFSMVGYLLMVSVIGGQLLFLRVRFRYKVYVVLATVLFLIAAICIPSLNKATIGRVDQILDSLHGVSKEEGNWDSSRTAPFIVMKEYVEEKGAVGFFIGEGYGNFEWWLFNRYYGMATSFARGAIPNLIAALFLGVGIVGLSLFCFILIAYYRDLHWREKAFLTVFFFVLFNGYGIIVSETIWFIFLLLRLLYDLERKTAFLHYRRLPA